MLGIIWALVFGVGVAGLAASSADAAYCQALQALPDTTNSVNAESADYKSAFEQIRDTAPNEQVRQGMADAVAAIDASAPAALEVALTSVEGQLASDVAECELPAL